MRELDEDAAVDVIIITGSDPAFCAGLDLKELATGQHDLSDSVQDPDLRAGPSRRLGNRSSGRSTGSP